MELTQPWGMAAVETVTFSIVAPVCVGDRISVNVEDVEVFVCVCVCLCVCGGS